MHLYVYVTRLLTTTTAAALFLLLLCNTSTSSAATTNFIKYSRDAHADVRVINNMYSYTLTLNEGETPAEVRGSDHVYNVYKAPDYCECDFNQVNI